MASNSSFLSPNFSEPGDVDDIYFEFNDFFFSEEADQFSEDQQTVSQCQKNSLFEVNNGGNLSSGLQNNNHRLKSTKVSFKTKSDHDVLDDGYKWRKYGKKMEKSSSNPRIRFGIVFASSIFMSSSLSSACPKCLRSASYPPVYFLGRWGALHIVLKRDFISLEGKML